MASHGKRYRQSTTLLEQRPYTVDEALEILKKFPPTKFDQTVEITMRLGIDPKQGEQQVRGSVSLPAGLGKTSRVIVFAEPDMAEKAKKAGAVEAGLDELIQKVQDGWMDFEVAIAHPKVMSKVAKLGRMLGPQGKMPNPKSGTVTPDIEQAVREFAEGKVEYRNDTGANLHAPVGKMSFSADALKQNIVHFVDHVRRRKPGGVKGVFIRRIVISGSMTPGVEINLDSL